MPRQVMRRQAAENQYLHKDFHGALSCGIEYLHRHFGETAVQKYLRDFTRSYFAPLHEEILRRGLSAIREHFERIYRLEGGDVRFEQTPDELCVWIERCPAVTHMREHGYPVAERFVETIRTVNEALCEETPFVFVLERYDPQTGAGIQRFRRSEA